MHSEVNKQLFLVYAVLLLFLNSYSFYFNVFYIGITSLLLKYIHLILFVLVIHNKLVKVSYWCNKINNSIEDLQHKIFNKLAKSRG